MSVGIEARALEVALVELDDPTVRELGIHRLARLVREVADDCIIWTGGTFGGQYRYAQVHVPTAYAATGRGQCYAHRIVCEWAHGPAPTVVHQAAHACGVTRCVNPRHIRWATPAENNADKVTHGTVAAGERNPMAKLTAADVALMRAERAAKGTYYRDLARAFGVTTMTAYRAVVGQSWA